MIITRILKKNTHILDKKLLNILNINHILLNLAKFNGKLARSADI